MLSPCVWRAIERAIHRLSPRNQYVGSNHVAPDVPLERVVPADAQCSLVEPTLRAPRAVAISRRSNHLHAHSVGLRASLMPCVSADSPRWSGKKRRRLPGADPPTPPAPSAAAASVARSACEAARDHSAARSSVVRVRAGARTSADAATMSTS